MGSFQFNGAFTATPDPDVESKPVPVRGMFVNGKPVRQGWEEAELKFPPLHTAEFNELRTRYEANKNAYTVGKLPALSGYNYVNVTAWWLEPIPTGWDGPFAHGVTMMATRIVRG